MAQPTTNGAGRADIRDRKKRTRARRIKACGLPLLLLLASLFLSLSLALSLAIRNLQETLLAPFLSPSLALKPRDKDTFSWLHSSQEEASNAMHSSVVLQNDPRESHRAVRVRATASLSLDRRTTEFCRPNAYPQSHSRFDDGSSQDFVK